MSAINTVPELLRAQASRIPDRPFVRFRERSITYGEFDARTDQLAAGLADLGVNRRRRRVGVPAQLPGVPRGVVGDPEGGWRCSARQPGVRRARGGVRDRALAGGRGRDRRARGGVLGPAAASSRGCGHVICIDDCGAGDLSLAGRPARGPTASAARGLTTWPRSSTRRARPASPRARC